jgi:hypothetical protein
MLDAKMCGKLGLANFTIRSAQGAKDAQAISSLGSQVYSQTFGHSLDAEDLIRISQKPTIILESPKTCPTEPSISLSPATVSIKLLALRS